MFKVGTSLYLKVIRTTLTGDIDIIIITSPFNAEKYGRKSYYNSY